MPSDEEIIARAREIGLSEPERAPEVIAAARELLAETGVDTPGCDCGHAGMGPARHLKSCTWLATLAVPHPDTLREEPCDRHPRAPVIGGMCGGCTQYPASKASAYEEATGHLVTCLAVAGGEPDPDCCGNKE